LGGGALGREYLSTPNQCFFFSGPLPPPKFEISPQTDKLSF